MNALTEDDSQAAFQEYIRDAQRRLEHDLQAPDEPKQLRPGEDVRFANANDNTSGAGADRIMISAEGVLPLPGAWAGHVCTP